MFQSSRMSYLITTDIAALMSLRTFNSKVFFKGGIVDFSMAWSKGFFQEWLMVVKFQFNS